MTFKQAFTLSFSHGISTHHQKHGLQSKYQVIQPRPSSHLSDEHSPSYYSHHSSSPKSNPRGNSATIPQTPKMSAPFSASYPLNCVKKSGSTSYKSCTTSVYLLPINLPRPPTIKLKKDQLTSSYISAKTGTKLSLHSSSAHPSQSPLYPHLLDFLTLG